MKRSIVLITVVTSWSVLAASGGPVHATVSLPNGQIVFEHNDPALPDTMVTTVNPDGSHPVPVRLGEEPRWSPDGTLLATDAGGRYDATIVNPDTGTVRLLKSPDPTLHLFCHAWSPDAKRLACGTFADDPSRNGIYTIRTSDGGGLTRITSNATGLLDFIGDWSPDGKRLVFAHGDGTRPEGANEATFVVNVDGGGLHRISPWGSFSEFSEVRAGWSPDGKTILFPERCSLFTVHPDGTGLTKIVLAGIDPSSTCAFEAGWSPDGLKMVFALITNPPGGTPQQNIYTANADGTGVEQVTLETSWAFHDGSPDWGSHPLAT